jgi:glycosyltransferase involved in cell wall biosynthesis
LSVILQLSIPLFFSPHFGIFSHSTFAGKYLWIPYNELVGRKIFKSCQKVVAASTFEANNLHSILHVPQSDIVIIPHGVDSVDLSNKAKSDGIIRLLYVGHLLKLKGVHYIIQTLYELIYSNGTNAQLTIVGNGPHEFDLKKLAENLNVNNYINWINFQSSGDLIKLYKEADIFLLTSESENYGIVVGEALAFGTPVIVSKIPALAEFLDEPGCFGIEYPPEPTRLAQLILDIYRENPQVGPFTNRIRTWDKVSLDYISVYSDAVKKDKRVDQP